MRALDADGVANAGFSRARPLTDERGAPVEDLRGAATLFYLAGTITPALAAADPAAVREELETFAGFCACLRELERRPRVVFASSGGTVYDTSVAPPYAEDAPTAPTSAYGRAKLEMEDMVRAVAAVRPLILRMSNVYGPGQRVDRGQGVIAHWMAAAIRGEPLRVLGDPASSRDYVFIDDVTRAMIVAMAASADLPPILNIGSGLPTALGTLAEMVQGVVGGAELRREPGRAFDRERTWLDVDLVRTRLGWRADTGLREGLEATWRATSQRG